MKELVGKSLRNITEFGIFIFYIYHSVWIANILPKTTVIVLYFCSKDCSNFNLLTNLINFESYLGGYCLLDVWSKGYNWLIIKIIIILKMIYKIQQYSDKEKQAQHFWSYKILKLFFVCKYVNIWTEYEIEDDVFHVVLNKIHDYILPSITFLFSGYI